jgi:tetratricopeptide (TPR) repeat protein
MALGELLPLPAHRKDRLAAASSFKTLEHLRDDFVRAKIAPVASDLMGAALVLGQKDTVRDVAEMVMGGRLAATDASRRLAERVLESEQELPGELSTTRILDLDSDARRGDLRRLLAESPRNALRWTDLARLQTAIGKDHEASRSMRVARGLAPEDRHVLRSSARLAIHQHRPDSARAILLASPRTSQDPWLMACEISAADLTGQRSPLVRAARQLLADERFSDHELSELASVIATIELQAGDLRASRQLFRHALRAPSDNSIAQITWAAPTVGMDYDEQALAVPASWEARAIAAHRGGDWQRATDEATHWLDDQPFASRPGELGSYEASKGGDFKKGLELAERALHANPKEFLLHNNAAFCLLSMDDSHRAKKHLDAIDKQKLEANQIATFTATQGLYYYRTGAPELGRELYLRAIRASRDNNSRALATIMLAREELRAGMESATQARERAMKLAKDNEPELAAWVAQLGPPTDLLSTIRVGSLQDADAPTPHSLQGRPATSPRPRLPPASRRSSR